MLMQMEAFVLSAIEFSSGSREQDGLLSSEKASAKPSVDTATAYCGDDAVSQATLDSSAEQRTR